MPKEMMIRLSLGEADVLMMAEGVSYNPDVADDMVKKAQESLQKAVKLAVDVGIPVPDTTNDWDDDSCGCDDDCENCDGSCDDCECEQPKELTEREFIEKLLKGLDDGN